MGDNHGQTGALVARRELPLSEDWARRIMERALADELCAEVLHCLYDGGAVSIDVDTGALVFARSAGMLDDLRRGETHSCEWCRHNPNHPKCPLNAEAADDERCPHCGGDPQDYTLHAERCPTIDTCAQVMPTLERPWHPDAEWLAGQPFTGDRFQHHLSEAHPVDEAAP